MKRQDAIVSEKERGRRGEELMKLDENLAV